MQTESVQDLIDEASSLVDAGNLKDASILYSRRW